MQLCLTCRLLVTRLVRLSTKDLCAAWSHWAHVWGVICRTGENDKENQVDHREGLAPCPKRCGQRGNVDARNLATMIVDPAAMTQANLKAWARDLDWYQIADLFAGRVVAKGPHAIKLSAVWRKARGEWVTRAGWQTIAALAMQDTPTQAGSLPPTAAFFEGLLTDIELNIHSSKNRVRDAMNTALISIGTRSDALARKATATAKRIGPVDVDHGETGCKTPDAVPYIAKARAHRKRKAEKARHQKRTPKTT